MELDQAIGFARNNKQTVLTTIRGNGRPQLSNVVYHVGDDGLVRISITAERAKYKNLRRDPWAALHITRADFYAYVVIEGTVELSAVAQSPDDATVDELVEYYRAVAGEHENWAEYRQTMVTEQRVIARFTPQRAYGML